MRPALIVAGLLGCGAAEAGPGDPAFEVRRIDVGHGSSSVLIVDQDGDGSLDLLVSGGGGVTVLRGDGSGGFAVHEAVDAGEHPVDIAAGDLDRDGRRDLVVANHEMDYLTLLFAGPDGFASGRSERLPIDVSPHPHAVAVADMDEDGYPDIVVDDRDRERLRVYRGDGAGSFVPGEPIAVGGDPYRGMTLADIDGDGHLDVLTPNPRAVAIQLGDGAGGYARGPRLESASMPPFSTTVGDFDGDGILDVAAGSGEGSGGVTVWLGRGGAAFERTPASPHAIADGPTRLGVGDVDHDGIDDILVTSYLGDELAILLGGRGSRRVIRIELDDNPWDVAAGDLDQDGRMDLVVANDGGTRITVLLQRRNGR